ncbi:IS630 family transposase [Pseudomonas sp. NA-150]|uniref:IS630 family transposase n=1 Tax=Pseudomonas sp. NA-150 TaxID=3367525 RepID=UPI0037C9324A
MAKPATPFVLTPSDHATLQDWTQQESLAKRLGPRARILLTLADGFTPKEVCDQLHISPPVVFKWRKRFLEAGLEGLNDRPRSGQPRKLSSQKVKEILTLTTQRVPREATHWSVRLMAKYAAVTAWQVRQAWAASDFKPHHCKTLKISNDPHFADKLVDVVGLYLKPPDNAIVLSINEHTPVQPRDRTQSKLPFPANVYTAFDTLTCQAIGQLTQRRRTQALLAFFQHIDSAVSPELNLHVILDNSSAHKTPAIKQWLEQHSRFKLYVAPTSASWLNAVEDWLAQLERRAQYQGVFSSVAELKASIRQLLEVDNVLSAKPSHWIQTPEPLFSSVHKAVGDRQ